MPKPIPPEIRQIHDRCVVDVDIFEAWCAERGWSLRGIENGSYDGVTLYTAQLAFICEDPVLWARAFMNDPDNNDEPWTFFDYQEESIRAYMQDVLHQDGAEVGKTREIVVLVVWGSVTGFGLRVRRPWMLIGAPQQTHLDEIIEAVEWHFGASDEFEGEAPIIQRFWRKPKKHPHYAHRFVGMAGYAKVYYRPAGHDGEAFRGVHVNGAALMDEAAKIKNSKCWDEFHRAMKPGCIERIYSVPDGDRTTEYFKLSQKAVPSLPAVQPGLRKFHWPKTLMPSPFWDDERKTKMVERYGSTDAPGYVRNVLGDHGQAENPVWSWELLDKNISDVPGYICIKLTADHSTGEMHVECYRVELKINGRNKSPQNRYICDDYRDLEDFTDSASTRDTIIALLREFLVPAQQGVYLYGADLGFSKDPSEIRMFQDLGHERLDVVRIHMRGVEYDQQAELMYCLDMFNGFQGEWGVDFGSAGSAVVQILQNQQIFEDGDYENRLTGIMFAAVMDAVDEGGDLLLEEDKKSGEMKPVRLPAKELATNLMTLRMQRRGRRMPFDQEVIGHYTNHTSKEGARHRIFDKTDDHTIDAERVAYLRKALSMAEGGAPDVFSSGAHERAA